MYAGLARAAGVVGRAERLIQPETDMIRERCCGMILSAFLFHPRTRYERVFRPSREY